MQLHAISQDLYFQNQPYHDKDGKREKTCCYGRTFSLLRGGMQSSFGMVVNIVEKVFITLKVICADPNAFASVIKKFDDHLFALIEKLNKSAGEFQKLKAVIRSTGSCINALQIAADIDYFLKAKFKLDSKLNTLGRLALFTAHAGITFLWFSQIGFVNLNKIVNSLGNTFIFTKTIPLSLGYATARAFGIAHALFAIDALDRLNKPGNIYQKTIAKFELSAHAAEVFLDLMLVAGIVNALRLGIMAAICVSLGVDVLLYKEKHKVELALK